MLSSFRTTLSLSTLTWLSLMALPATAQYQAINLSPPALFTGTEVSSAAGSDAGQQAGFVDALYGNSHAALWSGSAASVVDINPTGFYSSQVLGIAGGQEAGFGLTTDSFGVDTTHAVLWSGSAASAVDLNPAQLLGAFDDYSQASGIGGGQQVGYGYGSLTQYQYQALLWTGTAASAINLQPTNLYGFLDSRGAATNGIHQVGSGEFTDGSFQTVHALAWSGTASSALDLNPSQSNFSGATAISGNNVAGYASFAPDGNNYEPHAVLWNLAPSAAGPFTFLDLNPAGYEDSFAAGVVGTTVVGAGDINGHSHALLWDGSAANYVDLNQFLPAGFTDAMAQGIDANGDIVGVAYTAGMYGIPRAFLWTPVAAVPEASSVVSFGLLLVLGLGSVMIAARKKKAAA
ncbi:MAG: hypothetical protein ACRYFS_08120 [Janthinobacterium lividum]